MGASGGVCASIVCACASCAALGARKAIADIADIDLPAERAQFGDDAAIVGIAAGRRLKIAGHRESQYARVTTKAVS